MPPWDWRDYLLYIGSVIDVSTSLLTVCLSVPVSHRACTVDTAIAFHLFWVISSAIVDQPPGTNDIEPIKRVAGGKDRPTQGRVLTLSRWSTLSSAYSMSDGRIVNRRSAWSVVVVDLCVLFIISCASFCSRSLVCVCAVKLNNCEISSYMHDAAAELMITMTLILWNYKTAQ